MLENIDAFFQDFAVDVTLPSAAVVRGIFDNAATVALMTEGTDPRLVLDSADATGLAYGQTITIHSVAWKIQTIEPDGTGVTTLTLIRA
jgi:hypothetical protein